MNNRPFSFSIAVLLATAFLSISHLRADTADATATNTGSTATAPAATAPAETAPAASPTAPEERPTTYTVISGDTLWDLSHKFNTSVKQLKKLNNLKKTHLKPGQVLKIPPAKTESAAKPPVKTTSTSKKKAKTKAVATHSIHHAQPAQDFDLPASTFASCPVPIQTEDTPSPAPTMTAAKPAPSLAATPKPEKAVAPSTSTDAPQLAFHARRFGKDSAAPAISYGAPAPAAKPEHRGFFDFFHSQQPEATDWGTRFTLAARDLANQGLEYNEDWRPAGESHSWSMDCSNTTRYLYRVATGIELPRTASDQYYYLHLQNKAWDVPQLASGFADCNYLRQNLKPGDLLFWENTYRPERQPPITHVMIFLGTNARGDWIMAGSQSSRGGEHNRRHGGPDIYVFNPTRPCGGYTTWLGFVHHQGRFCAYGRPLEADKSKLSMASNN